MADMKPVEYLYFPVCNGKWLRDSQGRPRVYKSAKTAIKNLERHKYDSIQLYALDDVYSREEFEEIMRKYGNG